MTDYAGRLYLHDREMHLDADVDYELGDVIEVVRGNGPREGDYMGTATVTGFDDDGRPTLDITLGR